MRSARPWFYMLAAAQAAFLIGWAGWHEMVLRRSPTVLLDVLPVDPAEILRGDYIRLSYVISTVPKPLFSEPPGTDLYGKVVCVELTPRGEFWEVGAAALERCRHDKALPAGNHRMDGRITSYGKDSVILDYGIDRYYVPEGKGNPRGKLTALVAITADGRPFLKQLYLDGRPYPH